MSEALFEARAAFEQSIETLNRGHAHHLDTSQQLALLVEAAIAGTNLLAAEATTA